MYIIYLIDILLLDIKVIGKQKVNIRRLYNNYDTYMYTIHHLSYKTGYYKGIIYDLDSKDRNTLIKVLLDDYVIEKIKNDNREGYKFIDKEILRFLKKHFIFKDEDNNHLCDRAVILNLKEIGVLMY